MNGCRICERLAGTLLWVGVSAWLAWPAGALGAVEQSFDVLQIGTRTYKNVTVTTKAEDYIFILHSAGMTNIKVRELPPELRRKLGYVEMRPPTSKAPTALLKKEFAKVDLAKIRQFAETWRGQGLRSFPMLAAPRPSTLIILLAAVVLFYVFFCHCCSLICQKAGTRPGPMVWLPALQLFPLLRAAHISPWWFLAWMVPLLNILGYILLSVKLVEARGKNVWVVLLLLLPVTSFFAFLYLAFSDPVARKETPVVEIMTLDAA